MALYSYARSVDADAWWRSDSCKSSICSFVASNVAGMSSSSSERTAATVEVFVAGRGGFGSTDLAGLKCCWYVEKVGRDGGGRPDLAFERDTGRGGEIELGCKDAVIDPDVGGRPLLVGGLILMLLVVRVCFCRLDVLAVGRCGILVPVGVLVRPTLSFEKVRACDTFVGPLTGLDGFSIDLTGFAGGGMIFRSSWLVSDTDEVSTLSTSSSLIAATVSLTSAGPFRDEN